MHRYVFWESSSCEVFYISEAYNNPPLLRLVSVFRRRYFIHLNIQTRSSSLCFLVRMIVRFKKTGSGRFLDLKETSIDPDFNYATVFLFCNQLKCYRKVDALRSTSQTFDKASVLQRLSYVFISRNRRLSSETERMFLHHLSLRFPFKKIKS